MNDFDQYLFNELIKDYASMNINDVHQEELYQRFLNLDYLDEVKPYLFTMRYLGLGTPRSRKALKELKDSVGKRDYILGGLYFDLMLFEKEGNEKLLERLKLMEKRGYTDIYLKERSHRHIQIEEEPVSIIEEEEAPEEIEVTTILFDTNAPEPDNTYYQGYEFTTHDTTYIHAVVYIKPLKKERKLNVHSSITYENYWSIVEEFGAFDDEIVIKPGDTYFTPSGWGNKKGTSYECFSEYTWTITYDEGKTYSKKFKIVGDHLEKQPAPVRNTALFASGYDNDRECIDNFNSVFNVSTLEYVNFRVFVDFQNSEKRHYQVFRKLVYLEDNTVLQNDYYIHSFKSGDWSKGYFWFSYGYRQPGKWKKGLYLYSFHFKNGETYEMTFSVV